MKKNGFTLVELLAVLVIMGLLSLLIVPQVSKYIKKTTKTTYESYAKTLADATKNYLMDHPNEIPEDAYDYTHQQGSITINAQTLISEGYMDSMQDPENSKLTCDKESKVLIRKHNNASGYPTIYYRVILICGNNETKFNDDVQ